MDQFTPPPDCPECDDLVRHLFEFLDAEMEAQMQLRMEEHVRTCAYCTELTDAEEHVRELVRRSCQEMAPTRLRLRIVSELRTWTATAQ